MSPLFSAGQAKAADFDSATAMALASARFLAGKDFPILGHWYGPALRPVLAGLNLLPERSRRWLYRVGSGREGLPPEVVGSASADALAGAVVRHFPRQTYPGAVIGSTPGSAVHLSAALGMPLLPQTLLLPLARDGVSPDDPKADIAAVRPVAEALLERNPDLVVHHMSDPNNDRLTLAKFSYFRLKRTALGPAYEQFLTEHVEPGGTLFLVESGYGWPTTRLADRYYFQFGGIGGLTPDEYFHGGDRVAAFLRREGSDLKRWDAPEPDGMSPEAEWGFQPSLADDVQRFAAEHGFKVVRLRFGPADDLSPLVADFHRWWYRSLGRAADRLFVESFVLIDPHWVLRAGAVPYWVTFNTEPGVEHLARYLDAADPYDRIQATLISNGTWTVGLAGPDHWDTIFVRARRGGGFSGVDVRRFPSDLAVFTRYRDALRHAATSNPLPPPVTVRQAEEFLVRHGPRFGITVGATEGVEGVGGAGEVGPVGIEPTTKGL